MHEIDEYAWIRQETMNMHEIDGESMNMYEIDRDNE